MWIAYNLIALERGSIWKKSSSHSSTRSMRNLRKFLYLKISTSWGSKSWKRLVLTPRRKVEKDITYCQSELHIIWCQNYITEDWHFVFLFLNVNGIRATAWKILQIFTSWDISNISRLCERIKICCIHLALMKYKKYWMIASQWTVDEDCHEIFVLFTLK